MYSYSVVAILILSRLFNREIGWASKTFGSICLSKRFIQSNKPFIPKESSMRPCTKEHSAKQKNSETVEELEADLIAPEPKITEFLQNSGQWKIGSVRISVTSRMGILNCCKAFWLKGDTNTCVTMQHVQEKNKMKCMNCMEYYFELSNKAWKRVLCCWKFHNYDYYGLAQCDYKINGILHHKWKPPSETAAKQNKLL